ncbi:MAG: hypothetical protein FD170_3388 [Bacteroidetes bacterium]|nr:MAG: hypothetical protein FD170_3388 [Bacteroidota bacterium]
MFAITSSPLALSLTGMPLPFTIASDRDEDDYRIMALPFPGDPGAPVDIIKRGGYSDVHFELSEYFFNKRISEYSSLSSAVHQDACQQATIAFEEYYGNPPSGSNQITWTGLLMGGRIPRWKQYEFNLLYTSFSNWITTAKPFLTFAPRTGKRVQPDQPERLYWLNTLSATPATLTLICGVYFTDGSFVLYDPGVSLATNPNTVVSFATGFAQLGINTWIAANHPGKVVTNYYVQVRNNGGAAVSEAFLYVLDLNDYAYNRYLIFKNSLVGYDCIALTGEADEFTDIERFTAERVPDVNFPTRLHKTEYKSIASEVVKVNTGFLSNDERNWLNELYLSSEIYEVSGSNLIRILIKSKQLDRSKRIFEPGSVEIEYERLFLAEK